MPVMILTIDMITIKKGNMYETKTNAFLKKLILITNSVFKLALYLVSETVTVTNRSINQKYQLQMFIGEYTLKVNIDLFY